MPPIPDEHLDWAQRFTGLNLGATSGSGSPAADATGDANAGNDTPPVIAVNANGDGSFAVTGSGFVANKPVHVRIVNDRLIEGFVQTNSDGGGNISVQTPYVCFYGGSNHFSANDERQNPNDLTKTLWSNTVTAACPPAKGDDPDDPPDDPTPAPTPTPTPSDDSSTQSPAASESGAATTAQGATEGST